MANKFEEGAVVITSNQTAGRGQRGNTWESEAGANLTFSLLLKPRFLQATDQFLLTIVISLAITDCLKESEGEIDFNIKWPNDILANGKKICGMLIENTIGQSSIQQTIVGIGLNINQRTFKVTQATSLSILSGKQYDLNRMLNLILEKIEKRYLQLRSGKASELKADYLERLYGKGEPRSYIFKDAKVEGVIHGVDDVGKLNIHIEGHEHTLNNKEIIYLF
jgi:BirA family biotin operon repressor/biotin-[acetyl-CoA-carboxylase] ligase